MLFVAKFRVSLAVRLHVVAAEVLEGHVHVTPYTILHEITKNFRNLDGYR